MTAPTTNTAGTRRPLPCGIYAPTMTFFDPETEELDIPAIKKHAERLAKAGLAGLVTMGSNGEAAHCSREEKLAVTTATREALDAAGYSTTPIIIGATEGSVKSTVALCTLAASAGADYALILPPSYFRTFMSEQVIHDYFTSVADASPIPLILYNYPGAVAGIDMDSDLLVRLSHHPNIVGTKFTCGNTGKLTRVALLADAKNPSHEGSGYMAFGGLCDFTAQTILSGGSGIIAGGANVMPKLCVRVWDLFAKGSEKDKEEAVRLQKTLSKCDWVLTKAAIAGTKSAIQSYYGYGGFPRRPLERLDAQAVERVKEGIKEAMEIEGKL